MRKNITVKRQVNFCFRLCWDCKIFTVFWSASKIKIKINPL